MLMPRSAEFTEVATVRFLPETLARIRAMLRDGETVATFCRTAVENEIALREIETENGEKP